MSLIKKQMSFNDVKAYYYGFNEHPMEIRNKCESLYNIKQNDFSIKNQDYDINKVEENLIDEISKRSSEKNMIFNYKN